MSSTCNQGILNTDSTTVIPLLSGQISITLREQDTSELLPSRVVTSLTRPLLHCRTGGLIMAGGY